MGNFPKIASQVALWLSVIFGGISAYFAAWPRVPQQPAFTQPGASMKTAWLWSALFITSLILAGGLHVWASLIAHGKKNRSARKDEPDQKTPSVLTALQEKHQTQNYSDLVIQNENLEQRLKTLQADYDGFEWLRKIARKDRQEIDFMVRVTQIERGDLSYEPPRPFVIFRLHILNGSVFPISIHPSISGFVTYANGRLGGELSVSSKWEVKNLKRGWTAMIEIHLWLEQDDASFIKNDPNAANHFFNLEQVILKIIGGEPFYGDVTPQPLKIMGGVDQSGRQRG